MSKMDVPPPYTAVTQHAMFPKPSHDEAARFNFLAGFNRYLSGEIGAGTGSLMNAACCQRSKASMDVNPSTGMKCVMQ
jgi:hypothetical protein